MDWTVVEDLPVRRGALSEAESQWQLEQKLRRRAEKIWVRDSPKGYSLRNLLVHHFHYAFRDDSSLVIIYEGTKREAPGGIVYLNWNPDMYR